MRQRLELQVESKEQMLNSLKAQIETSSQHRLIEHSFSAKDPDKAVSETVNLTSGHMSAKDPDKAVSETVNLTSGHMSAKDPDKAVSETVNLTSGYMSAKDPDKAVSETVNLTSGHMSAKDPDKAVSETVNLTSGYMSAKDPDKAVSETVNLTSGYMSACGISKSHHVAPQFFISPDPYKLRQISFIEMRTYFSFGFSFQPVLHDWCNKGRGMCYPVCGMVHIKEPLLLIGKSSLCGGSGCPFSLSEWSLTICLTPYNRR